MENSTTTQPSGSPSPPFGKRWSLGWILANGMGWGVILGMPFVIADLMAEGTPVIQRYDSYVVPVLVLWMLGVGLLQWVMLRKPLAISAWWIGSFILPLILLLIPLVGVLPLLGEGTLVLLLGGYPLLLSLIQGWLLRQCVTPVWGWVLVSLIAISTAVPIGLILTAILIVGPNSQTAPGIWVCVGGGTSGLIYGLITSLGLKKLIGEKFSQTTPAIKKSALDVPPGDKPLKRLIISNLLFLATLIGWGLILPRPNFSNEKEGLFANPLAMIGFGLFLVLYPYVSILIHELGHLIFALCNGFDIQAIAVDRFVFSRSGKGFKSSRIQHRFAGGFVLPILKNSRSPREKLFWMFLGGPTASLCLFLIGAVPLFASELLARTIELWLMTLFASQNLFFFIYNLLPLRLGYLKTDGRRMLDLVRGNADGKRVECIYRFNAALRQGIRPKDIDAEIIEGSLAIPEHSPDHISGLMMAYAVALDQAQFELAGDYLDQALAMNAYYPQSFRGSLLLEGAYFEAQIRQQSELAQQWFEQIQDKALIEPYSLLRAEAALLLAQGDPNAALVKAEQGLASVQQDVFKRGQAAAESEWLQALLQAAAEDLRSIAH